MIVEYIRYSIPESELDSFTDGWSAAAPLVRDNPHNHSLEVSRCLDEPGSFVVRIIWDTREGHLQGFRGSPVFQTFLGHVGAFMDDIQEMRHYEVLGGI